MRQARNIKLFPLQMFYCNAKITQQLFAKKCGRETNEETNYYCAKVRNVFRTWEFLKTRDVSNLPSHGN
jgi:hypothetical protein